MTASAALGNLPEWNLADLYAAPDAAAFATDMQRGEAEAKVFAEKYKGKLGQLSGDELAEAVKTYEIISDLLGRTGSYAQLYYVGDTTDAARGKFYGDVNAKLTDISTQLLFFELELNRIDDAALEKAMQVPALNHYRPWIENLRKEKPYQLEDKLEELFLEKSQTGYGAFNRLFDETMADLRFEVDGQSLAIEPTLNLLQSPDEAKRKAGSDALAKTFKENLRLFTLITNTLAKDKEIIDTWRHYPTPGSYRNRSNMVEDEVVDALVGAVQDSFPRISHRYYTMKAKWLGLPKLMHWDRNAPLPDDDDQKISWAEAQERVVSAYGAFSPDLATLGKQFFDKPWIDATTKPGKSGGAFSHPTVPSAHPYILMNYHGRTRDVMTLAHELGHGVHQLLAAQQGYLLSNTPLTLAETASVFGEMLTFRALLDAEKDTKRRRIMLASKVEDMINTVVRQIAFYQFEKRVHDERRQGEIMPERLGEIWMGVQRESLGPIFDFTPDYANFWAYIPHFVHSPFYVYAYAFGDCLVNALYDVFRDGHKGFQAKYLDMLRSGGTKRHKELLAPFGLDASDPRFWMRGLDVISGFVDELEEAG